MRYALPVAIYFVLWWLVLFAVLPWGVRSQKEAGTAVEGSDPGAPVVPRLLLKAVATTVIASILFGAGYAVWQAGWVSLDSFPVPFERIKH
jgi:predicted secreted protein